MKLPAGWELRHSNTHNRPYYFNTVTNKSQWDVPTAPATESDAPRPPRV